MFKEEYLFEYIDNLEREEKEIVEREIDIELIKEKIIALIGPRRAGKSTYLKYIYKRMPEALYLELEEEIFSFLSYEDIIKIISLVQEKYNKEIKVILLDEIQVMKDWERIVRSLLNRGYSIVITGSSSKLLSYEISTRLRGRTLSYLLLPFSFREFLKAKKHNFDKPHLLSLSEKIKLLNLLKEYLHHGGYPEIVLYPELRERILKEYAQTIFYKDFVDRFGIRSVDVARFMFEFFRKNFSKEISVNKIANYIKSVLHKNVKDTVYEYFSLLSETLFIFILNHYSPTSYKTNLFKSYLCDTGFSLNKDIGFLMENVVFLELKRRENTKPLQEVYYYKTRESYEVDFLIKEGMGVKELMQVCYANSYDEIPEREIRALLHAKEELNLGDEVPLTVITWDYEDTREVEWWRKRGKIRFVPLWKWLLQV